MKLIIVLAFATVVVARPGDDKYDSKYDNFNMDEVINNKRLLKSYSHCFIGDGKCTAEGNDIKKWIPEATKTSCEKCSDKQKELVAKAIRAIMEKLPEEWEILNKQTDPEGKYAADLKKFLAEH